MEWLKSKVERRLFVLVLATYILSWHQCVATWHAPKQNVANLRIQLFRLQVVLNWCRMTVVCKEAPFQFTAKMFSLTYFMLLRETFPISFHQNCLHANKTFELFFKLKNIFHCT
uniref:Uncharacterized protein n=1 Tax=Rhipicephalus zambeziensis TaxID=60191 RepID=A0A224YC09_9ACAR